MPKLRRLAVMFTDMKGFTARSSRSTWKELMQLLREHDQHVWPSLENRGGRLIKTIGDALMVSFPHPTHAVLAAREAQESLAQHNAKLSPKDRIEIRIGIHYGEVSEVDGDLFGDTVNVASRIEHEAKVGGIYFSEAVKAQIPGHILKSICLGPKRFKGISDPVVLYTLKKGGAFGQLEAWTMRTRRSWPIRAARYALAGSAIGAWLLSILIGISMHNLWLLTVALLFWMAWAPWPLARLRRQRGTLAVAATLFVVATAPRMVGSFQKQLDALSSRLDEKGDAGVTTTKRLGVYATSLAFSAIQHCLVPTFQNRVRLRIHLPNSGLHVQLSDALWRSSAVQKRLRRFVQRLKTLRHNARFPPHSKSVVRIPAKNSPLNQLTALEFQATWVEHAQRWRIKAIAESDVHYSSKGRESLRVGSAGKISIDKSLMALLQKSGWLHPYTQRWVWHMNSDDPRFMRDFAGRQYPL